ncbi:MAG: spore coat protein [Clostridium sp.]|uniref:spore coat protein n=1 Tax=Clostridium sp. TaxID=1506 RepID=UPI0025C2078A|nr:spore coat protein [Clostridium sp.]MCF0148349.1 spore coat protein [Clostridium sp.]
MFKVIGDLIKDNVNIDDKLLCESMMNAAKDGAMLYLTSALTSTTPELRTIYSASLTQSLEGHTALTELSVKKGWVKPYEEPISMLNCEFNCAEEYSNEIKK